MFSLKQVSSSALQENPILHLPDKITYKGTHVFEVLFDSGSNEMVVAPSEFVQGSLIFRREPKDSYNIFRQILVGIKNHSYKQLVFSERKVIGKRLEGFLSVGLEGKVYESYHNYKTHFQFKAPENPGVYELEVSLIELIGEEIENPGTINGFFMLKSQDEKMLSSKEALTKLSEIAHWQCKVSMGIIRVI